MEGSKLPFDMSKRHLYDNLTVALSKTPALFDNLPQRSSRGPPLLGIGVKVNWSDLPETMRGHFIEHHMKDKEIEQNFCLNVIITVIYFIVFIIGIPSNVLTMVVIIYNKGAGGGTMSPTDNFLLNLSIVDVFSLLVSK